VARTSEPVRDPFALGRTVRVDASEGGGVVHHTPRKWKPSHKRTKAGSRTNSKRRLAGSKFAKRHGGYGTWRDKIESVQQALGNKIGPGVKPWHAKRAISMDDCFPQLGAMPALPMDDDELPFGPW
jgi:hypothetical protein